MPRHGKTSEARASQRLDSWKKIASYLKRGERTVQRWEREEGLPVHRLAHDKRSSVYAYTDQLDAWRQHRQIEPEAAPRQAPAPQRSIAVLPFSSIGGDQENQIFSDGLAEEILGTLARVDGLKVIARTSAFSFRGKDAHVREVAAALGVRYVLEGSVRRVGNRIRVSVQLADAADGYQIWSELYDRELLDVFAVQEEITEAVVEILRVRLAPQSRAHGPASPEAYHALLNARCHDLNGRAPENTMRALEYCDRAISLDPGYAAAHARRSLCLLSAGQQGWKPLREALPLARAAAQAALELDPTVPEAHYLLAIVAATFDYDWKAALRHYRRSEPEDTGIAATCAQTLLLPLRRFDESRRAMDRALSADPFSKYPRFILAQTLLATGSYERARRELDALLALHGSGFEPYFGLGILLTLQTRTDEAIAILERGIECARWFAPIHGLLAANYRRAGNASKADALIQELGSSEIGDIARGYYFVVAREPERAGEEFQKVLDRRHFAASIIAYNPLCAEFRRSAPGRSLLAQMNLAAG
jgi:TolB-like protein